MKRKSEPIVLSEDQMEKIGIGGEVRESGICPNHLVFLANCLADGYWPLKLMPNIKQRTGSLPGMGT